MPERRIYNDPAVVQAAIELRVRPLPDTDSPEAKKWESYQAPAGYSHEEDQEREHVSIEARGDGIRRETQSQLIARKWIDHDQRKIIHITPDRMGLLHHRGDGTDHPCWKGWESLKSDTLSAWKAFREVVPEQAQPLSQIGVKYINRFDLPGENLVLDRYFRTLPDTSADLPGQGMSKFMIQLDLPQPDDEANVRLILVRVPPPADQDDVVSVILDIEAYRKVNSAAPLADSSLDDTLEVLHRLENAVFESTLTNQTRQLMKPETPSGSATP